MRRGRAGAGAGTPRALADHCRVVLLDEQGLTYAATVISRSSINVIWRSFNLKPHCTETFKLSTDPKFVEKVRDIVGLYLSPLENAVVISVDEKSQMQALDSTQPLLPMRPGRPERRAHHGRRHGTSRLFAALMVMTGGTIGQCHRRHGHLLLQVFG